MADNARGIHVSPGIYSKETELTYAVKSLGITTLGLVGETQRGPAFQPMLVENWRDFQSLFGGTSPEKFLGSQYPKYELPYIAKSYLTESNQLQVCRVLGLSGYNAGPAWAITANVNGAKYKGDEVKNKEMIVAVIRSRAHYEEYHKYEATTGTCECPSQAFDTLFYEVGEKNEKSCSKAKSYNMKALAIKSYVPLTFTGDDCNDYKIKKDTTTFNVTPLNLGRFKLVGFKGFQVPEIDASNGDTESDVIKNALTVCQDWCNKVQTPYNKDEWEEYLKASYFEYPVSFNPEDKEYIFKVLGNDPINGESPIFVESLYDVALKQLIETENIKAITNKLTPYQVYHKADYCFIEAVNDIVSKQEESLSRKDVGKRFLADKNAADNNIHCHVYDFGTKKPIMFDFDKDKAKPYFPPKSKEETLDHEHGEDRYKARVNSTIKMEDVVAGQVYVVRQYTDANGKRHYFYTYYTIESIDKAFPLENQEEPNSVSNSKIYMTRIERKDKLTLYNKKEKEENFDDSRYGALVRCNADGKYYRAIGTEKISDIAPVTCDMNDYRDAYRFASTPWIVSNVKGDFNKIELNKMFRFHTISDGSTSNNEIKVSIQNLKPDEGVFDVVVRDINDSDESQVVLERFGRCSMIPNTPNYIAYKIGSYDGLYESKSKFITVEVNETDAAIHSIPSGFLGYPLSRFNGLQVRDEIAKDTIEPILKYNLNFDEDIKHRKQYFGLSSWTGVDIDAFTYKGNAAYSEEPEYLSQGFHLDSRLDCNAYEEDMPKITVDGVEGYFFDGVATNNRTHVFDETPIIGTEAEMTGSIYEYVDLRKFTVYFYGGFDGWDVYRDHRSNTNSFKLSKYRGDYNELSGEGFSFNRIDNPDLLKLNQQGITSDWYAYLSGARQFANPEEVDINVFATPGIDLINNKLLADEIIEMIEEERADSIYVATMPDKPMGASDYIDEMYSPDDVVYELEDTEIDSNYTCTYYPWIKYEDVDNSQYIYLPPTKDVVRNMAMTDNTTHPWFAPAGISRGDVNCVRAHYVTKLSDEDVLYEGRINPVKTFASDGVKIWGQKNLQKRESQLNRIAVRRLLLRMRKLVAISCIGLIFDPNDATTKNKFLSTVTPILDNIKSNRGISDYKIEVNDTIESRERRELPAKIFFKPYNALEYIDLNFILTPEGVSFDNI